MRIFFIDKMVNLQKQKKNIKSKIWMHAFRIYKNKYFQLAG